MDGFVEAPMLIAVIGRHARNAIKIIGMIVGDSIGYTIGKFGAGGGDVGEGWHHLAFVKNEDVAVLYTDGKSYHKPAKVPLAVSPSGRNITLPISSGFPLEFRAFRVSSKPRYQADGFEPPKEFDKDRDTVILLDFAGEGKKLKDLAGKHDATVTNGEWVVRKPPPNPDQPRSVALQLNGRNNVELVDTAGIFDGDDFTVEAWVKLPPPVGPYEKGIYMLFGDFRAPGPERGGWDVSVSPAIPVPGAGETTWNMSLNVNGGGEGPRINRVGWTHVAVVRRSGDGLTLFVAGQPLIVNDRKLEKSSNNFFLGKPTQPPGTYYRTIGEFRAFRASSAARYKGAFSPPRDFKKDANTIILLDFAGDGEILADLAGKHEGRITGGEWLAPVTIEAPDPDKPKVELWRSSTRIPSTKPPLRRTESRRSLPTP
ncbi:hypothetical protein AYO40_04770 [Planctomycetaceae bacterium SCGC AG-212-D15]|nr:hypothetical protein AYO40_04770 [Planctomycetaceae bacterium SCGC AG-212-D15]